METLGLLEKKIDKLIETIKELTAKNDSLLKDNDQLAHKVKSLQATINQDSKNLEELDQERELTKMAVDNLIKSIDSLVGKQK